MCWPVDEYTRADREHDRSHKADFWRRWSITEASTRFAAYSGFVGNQRDGRPGQHGVTGSLRAHQQPQRLDFQVAVRLVTRREAARPPALEELRFDLRPCPPGRPDAVRGNLRPAPRR